MVYARPNEAVMKFSLPVQRDPCTRIIYGGPDLSSVYNAFNPSPFKEWIRGLRGSTHFLIRRKEGGEKTSKGTLHRVKEGILIFTFAKERKYFFISLLKSG